MPAVARVATSTVGAAPAASERQKASDTNQRAQAVMAVLRITAFDVNCNGLTVESCRILPRNLVFSMVFSPDGPDLGLVARRVEHRVPRRNCGHADPFTGFGSAAP